MGCAPRVGCAVRAQSHVVQLHRRSHRSRSRAPQGVGKNACCAVAPLVLQGLLVQQGLQVWLLQLQNRDERVVRRLWKLVIGLLNLERQWAILCVVTLLGVRLLLLQMHVMMLRPGKRQLLLGRLLELLRIRWGLLHDKLLWRHAYLLRSKLCR